MYAWKGIYFPSELANFSLDKWGVQKEEKKGEEQERNVCLKKVASKFGKEHFAPAVFLHHH